ncbi:MAG: (deoxy)nucleoside triphosphate pyrophosphohydrolase [Nitrospinota bacterium]|nr:(deoxy)nucleoside triphosphate pyrophosphohydrolase [Nitrospinota bacterium]
MVSKIAKIKVVAGVIFNQGKILITKRPYNVHQGGKWEFPGGKVNLDEAEEQALKRELFEELSVDVDVANLILETNHFYENLEVNLLFYECTINSNKVTNLSVLQHKWITLPELLDYSFPPANEKLISLLLERF